MNLRWIVIGMIALTSTALLEVPAASAYPATVCTGEHGAAIDRLVIIVHGHCVSVWYYADLPAPQAPDVFQAPLP